jgi:hypothetical protein
MGSVDHLKGQTMKVTVNGTPIEDLATDDLCDLCPPSEGGMKLANALLTVKRLVLEMNQPWEEDPPC